MNSIFTKLNYCTKINIINSKQLYKYLLKECKKLPSGPREHYIFSIKQNFKQHIEETDSERVSQMIKKSLDDANWILKKVRLESTQVLRKKIKMCKIALVTGTNIVPREKFWNSVLLYHSIPHVINRRILSATQLFCFKIKYKNNEYAIRDVMTYFHLHAQVKRFKSINSEDVDNSIITNIFVQYENNFTYEDVCSDEIKESVNDTFVSVRILFPRNVRVAKSIEFVIIDKKNNIVSFIPVATENTSILSPKFPYDITLDKTNLLQICIPDVIKKEDSDWLANCLFPKLITWTENNDENNLCDSNLRSLSLIANERYYNLYRTLKLKYADILVKNWTEKTDPLKFVYEDISIAAYLLALWENYALEKQNFVDLGCGNGLLVHILSQEGHNGFGIDIRPRKIWTMFPNTTRLKVDTIVPSTKFLFPEADWLLGNHSDELSPWVPVLAARSSPKCKYWLLPCCSYEFDGKKYQRYEAKLSQYQNYLAYLKTISYICGFETEVDKLRIPSTKRICLVGAARTCTDFKEVDKNINKFISERIGRELSDTNVWVENYETRPAEIPVTNCTKLDKDLINNIVKKVFMYLLSQDNYIITSSGKKWNAGGNVSLPDLVKLVSSEDLQQLKNNSGGLQTLLKNHYYIFMVKKGTVKLRMPIEISMTKTVIKTKTRGCWYNLNHPDGCPLENEKCSYIH